MYKTVCIGIDQSYSNTGISVAADGKLLDIKSIRLNKFKAHSARRAALKSKLGSLIAAVAPKSEEVVCIVERARIHGGGDKSFINLDAILTAGVLASTVVDVCDPYGIPVYSVDTRSWKAQVVGTSKPQSNKYGVPSEKWPTVRWVCRQGMENKILLPVHNPRKNKGTFVRGGQKYQYNHDAADSAGLAMYWFRGSRDMLKLER